MISIIQLIVNFIGGFILLRFCVTFVWEIVKEIVTGFEHLTKYGKKEGNWAVVTGGTDGIGLGFCQVLADLGWNVCIISRNQQKIKKTIQNIQKNLTKYGKNTPNFMYVVADFKNSSQPGFYQNIMRQLENIKIGILINNVGTADTKFISQFSTAEIIDLININCISMAALTALLVPKMKDYRSAIINLSSFLGQNPAPYSSLYSATKAFNTYFSQSISMEKGLQKIDILSVRPMFVVSPLSKQKQAFTVPGRKQCASACLKQLRWEYETNGYIIHRMLALLYSCIPKFIIRPITARAAYHKMIQYRNS